MTETIKTEAAEDVEGAKAFSVSERHTGVSSGNSKDYVIKNPSSNNKPIVVLSLKAASDGLAEVDFFTGTSIDTSGTDMNSQNLRVGSGVSKTFTAESGGSYSGDSLVAERIVPGGGAGSKLGADADSASFILEPGEVGRVNLENQSGTSGTLNFSAVVYDPNA